MSGPGEGSRGGKVVGHTSSGKPIYQSAGNHNHKTFTKEDHADAALHHSHERERLSEEYHKQHNGDGTYSEKHAKKKAQLKKQIEHHYQQSLTHRERSLGKPRPYSPDQKDFDRMDRKNDPQKRSSAWGRSQGDQSMDILKSLGITTEHQSLLKSDRVVVKSNNDVFHSQQVVRKGFGDSPGERLEEQLNKGMAIAFAMPEAPKVYSKGDDNGDQYGGQYLKNTHGEEHHSDNDKKVEEWVTDVAEIDPSTGQDDIEYPAHKYMNKMGKERKGPKPTEKSFYINSDQAEIDEGNLFLKAMGEGARGGKVTGHSANGKPVYAKNTVATPKFPTINTKHDALGSADAYKRKERLETAMAAFGGKKKSMSKSDSLIEMHEEQTPPELIANVHENFDGVNERLRPAQLQLSVSQALDDLCKGPMAKFIDEEAKEKEHSKASIKDLKEFDKEEGKEPQHMKKGYEGFKKVAAETGSPALAAYIGRKKYGKEKFDHAAAAGKKMGGAKKSDIDELVDVVKGKCMPLVPDLKKKAPTEKTREMAKSTSFIKSVGPGGLVFDFGNRTGNPVADRATDLLNTMYDPQQAGIASAQRNEYAKSLDAYVKNPNANPTQTADQSHDEWNKVLSKSTDEQVKSAFEAGLFDEKGPAIKNGFNATEINLGGEVIKATGETDRILIEMMKAEQAPTDPNAVTVDTQSGGKISVCAGE